jgi:mono/diheme cytochrome c family protein
MPGFKHYFQPADFDAIIDYVRTVPVPPEASAAR